MVIPPAIVTLVLGMALVLLGLWVGQNVNLLPADASSNAPVYDELFNVLFSIGTVLFVGITGLLIYSLVRFRRPRGDLGDGAAIEGNLPLELFWTAVPAVVVLFVGIYSYNIYDRMGGMAPLNDHGAMHAATMPAGSHGHHRHGAAGSGQGVVQVSNGDNPATDQASPEGGSGERLWGGIGLPRDGDSAPLPVEVTAMQFAFIFRYPGSDIVSGELHLPAGAPVELRLQANDVIHAFWVPQFRIKQDVIPGQPTVLSFVPTRPGSYPIVCAELCGPYHGGMRSTVVVQEPDEFDAWVAANSPAPPSTT